MTTQDLTDLLIIHDTTEAISEAISSVFGEIGEELLKGFGFNALVLCSL